MKLDKPIKILTVYMKGSDEAEPVDFDKAVKLGIKVVERLKKQQTFDALLFFQLLPGETKE